MTAQQVIESLPVLPNGFSVTRIAPADIKHSSVLKEIGELRYLVWKDQGMDMSNSLEKSLWIEKADYFAHHWILYKDGQTAASARLTLHNTTESLSEARLYSEYQSQLPAPIASFNRLVVLESFRGIRLSHYLDQVRSNKALEVGAKCITLDCPEFRAASLKKRGFSQLGVPVPGVKCPSVKWTVMKKMLTSFTGREI